MDLDGCPLPEDRSYDLEENLWVANAPEGTFLVGLIAAFTSFIGTAREVSFRPVEGSLDRGRSVGTVESIRFTGAVRMPFDGVILERNHELERQPRLLNDDPYGRGWVVRIRPRRPEEPRGWLESASGVRERLLARIRRDRIRCWPATPDLEMIEIGLECSAILTMLNEELERRPGGTAVLLVTDDPTSPIEVERWSDQTGHAVLARRREGNLHQFLLRKEDHPVPRIPRRG